MPRFLGIDYGQKRVGLALSDEAAIIAMPLEVLTVQHPNQAVAAVCRVCQEREVAGIVIGLPLNMNGSQGPSAEAAKAFGERLRSQRALPVEFWDERLSSQQAERVLIDADVRRSKRKTVIDMLAAQTILQSWLDRRQARVAQARDAMSGSDS